jgi:hypothetical protein
MAAGVPWGLAAPAAKADEAIPSDTPIAAVADMILAMTFIKYLVG